MLYANHHLDWLRLSIHDGVPRRVGSAMREEMCRRLVRRVLKDPAR